MAASCPLHRDGSASRQPSSHSLHGITASNAALPSHKHEGLVGPLRPWSGSRSCGRPPRPRPLPFARASRADARTKTGACGRTVRTPPRPQLGGQPIRSLFTPFDARADIILYPCRSPHGGRLKDPMTWLHAHGPCACSRQGPSISAQGVRKWEGQRARRAATRATAAPRPERTNKAFESTLPCSTVHTPQSAL